MIKYTYAEFKELMIEHQSTGQSPIVGVIVFTEDSFKKPYSLESRSYAVLSNNKAFGNFSGYSIFGSALDGSDSFVRLERYMAEEHGGENGWKVDYCYFPDTDPETNKCTAYFN